MTITGVRRLRRKTDASRPASPQRDSADTGHEGGTADFAPGHPESLHGADSDPDGGTEAALDEQLHRERGGVPSARRETAEERAARCVVVEMERLRIELCGERLDGRSVHPQRLRDVLPARGEILEVHPLRLTH